MTVILLSTICTCMWSSSDHLDRTPENLNQDPAAPCVLPTSADLEVPLEDAISCSIPSEQER